MTKHPTTSTRAGNDNRAVVYRRCLDIDLDPLDVLRLLRGRDRLVGLIGAWHHGEALVACDPVKVAEDPFDLDLASSDTAGFGGGWIGAWGYQLGSRIERLPVPGHRPTEQPEHRVAFYDHVLRLSRGQWWLESLSVDKQRDAELLAQLARAPERGEFAVGTFEMTPEPEQHRLGVRRALEHIAAGDIFQVNLCARLESEFSGDEVELFCQGAEQLKPAYGAFVSSPEGALASFSPELFLRRTGSDVLTSPIKGTAALDSDANELVASSKNRAENVMIVDLMRNDLGRLSVPGSVRVPALNRLEQHAVWHLVSDVVGHLGHDVTNTELLRATFPPGSVTGAPKVRAMEIINALEPTAREAYTGAIGYASVAAGIELNVVIRTFEISGDRVWLGVGGGIVADSDPDDEFNECLVKARPLIEAIGGSLDVVPVHVRATEHVQVVKSTVTADPQRGIFETLLVVDGRAYDVAAHVARLDASVRTIYGGTVTAGLEDAIFAKASRLVGKHRLRVSAQPVGADVRVTMTADPLPDVTANTWQLQSNRVEGGWGAHKWSDRDALGEQSDETESLLVDGDGSVLEGARSSVFVVDDHGVHTPPTDGRILPGTARAAVIELLIAAGIPVIQRRMSAADLLNAHEVFCSNALRGVVAVANIDGRALQPWGPMTRFVSEELWRMWRGDQSCTVTAPARPAPGMRVLVIDNYDSFVYNLVQYARELSASTDVVRNDQVSVDQLVAARATGQFDRLIISPGPGRPADAGVSVAAVRRLAATTPILGVCLGHQAIAEAFGAEVVRARDVVHGKPSVVHHDSAGLHAGLAGPLVVGRYHSLVIDEATLPAELVVTSRTAGGLVMGVRHRELPIEGVQWHPESILTVGGHQVIANFLSL